jgi:calcium-dependent protein kinase
MNEDKNSVFLILKKSFINNKKSNIINEYTFGSTLGAGSFGTVRKAVHKLTGQTRAIKILKKKNQDQKQFYMEVDILCKLTHPNIMQIYEFFEDTNNFYLVSEFCSGGELFEKISEKGSLSEPEAAYIMKQLISAIYYCHQSNIVHRDLKPENILFDDKSEKYVIKLIDWGGGKFFLYVSSLLFQKCKTFISLWNPLLYSSRGSFWVI